MGMQYTYHCDTWLRCSISLWSMGFHYLLKKERMESVAILLGLGFACQFPALHYDLLCSFFGCRQADTDPETQKYMYPCFCLPHTAVCELQAEPYAAVSVQLYPYGYLWATPISLEVYVVCVSQSTGVHLGCVPCTLVQHRCIPYSAIFLLHSLVQTRSQHRWNAFLCLSAPVLLSVTFKPHLQRKCGPLSPHVPVTETAPVCATQHCPVEMR